MSETREQEINSSGVGGVLVGFGQPFSAEREKESESKYPK